MPDDPEMGVEQGEDESDQQDAGFSPQVVDEDHNDPSDASSLDVNLSLSEEKKSEIVSYLEDNLAHMQMSAKDEDRIRAYLAMYDMASRKRDFPYENAPSMPSSDAYDKMNEWLDKAEVAFLITNGTFTIDREEVSLDEQVVRRMEKTWHKKYFWGSGFAEQLRLILFEAGYLGGSILSVNEEFDIEPIREKVVIKTQEDLSQYQSSITKKAYDEAVTAIAKNQTYLTERDVLKINHAGAKIGRINQTNFLYPQNIVDWKKWEIVAEREFYTRTTLEKMAEMGEIDSDALQQAVAKNRYRASYLNSDDSKKAENLPPGVAASGLDLSHGSNLNGLKTYGDGYDEEFCLYRVTLKYKVSTDEDPSGNLRSWIQVVYCPAGGNLFSSKFSKYGFPYFLVQFRPVPHRALGSGIAQARYPFNVFDSDMKSLFMASLEQEIGAPTLIKLNSSLWSSGFRTYPGSTAYTENPDTDVKSFQMPEKSRLAVEGMKIALSSSPGANQGAGYSSGKREQIMQEQKNVTDQSRMHAIAVGLDAPMNLAWKITCQVAKLNTDSKKWIDWVYEVAPTSTKLFMLDDEMSDDIVWTSVLSAISMSPDALAQRAQMLYQTFHEQVPVSVNSPRLSVEWLNFLANYFPEFDAVNRQKLLPNPSDYQQYQQQLGQMGGQREGQPSTPAVAQSPKTPFSRPGGNGQAPQKPAQGNGAFSPQSPVPGQGGGFSPRMPTP